MTINNSPLSSQIIHSQPLTNFRAENGKSSGIFSPHSQKIKRKRISENYTPSLHFAGKKHSPNTTKNLLKIAATQTKVEDMRLFKNYIYTHAQYRNELALLTFLALWGREGEYRLAPTLFTSGQGNRSFKAIANSPTSKKRRYTVLRSKLPTNACHSAILPSLSRFDITSGKKMEAHVFANTQFGLSLNTTVETPVNHSVDCLLERKLRPYAVELVNEVAQKKLTPQKAFKLYADEAVKQLEAIQKNYEAKKQGSTNADESDKLEAMKLGAKWQKKATLAYSSPRKIAKWISLELQLILPESQALLEKCQEDWTIDNPSLSKKQETLLKKTQRHIFTPCSPLLAAKRRLFPSS